jgi:hypothetical protein
LEGRRHYEIGGKGVNESFEKSCDEISSSACFGVILFFDNEYIATKWKNFLSAKSIE